MHFNSHAHVERDGRPCTWISRFGYFNSHAHVERDLPIRTKVLVTPISTHTLTWSVTGVGVPLIIKVYISTHTLTWSVTVADDEKRLQEKISTHTLTWSVTRLLKLSIVIFKFQLTRSRGAWRLKKKVFELDDLISTHTLTWSVTFRWTVASRVWRFQLTRSRGAWRTTFSCRLAYNHFNSHAHVERDQQGKIRVYKVDNFNSHAHVERDSFFLFCL